MEANQITNLSTSQIVSILLMVGSAFVLFILYRAMRTYRKQMIRYEHVFVRLKFISLTGLAIVQAYTFVTNTSTTPILLKLVTGLSILAGYFWVKTLRRYDFPKDGAAKNTAKPKIMVQS